MLPTPCQKQSGTILRSPPAAWPRGHSQLGLGLLPEKASYSLWEGFPLPGWKGWLKGVRQPAPCPATSLLSGCLVLPAGNQAPAQTHGEERSLFSKCPPAGWQHLPEVSVLSKAGLR